MPKLKRDENHETRLSCRKCGGFRFTTVGKDLICQNTECQLVHEYWVGRYLPKGTEIVLPDLSEVL